MKVNELSLEGLLLVKPDRYSDDRGFFQQSYHYDQYAAAGIDAQFVQDNWSRSSRGTIRGLHYQYHTPQAKLVSVLRGEVVDVVVDMREASPTYGKWEAVSLSEHNGYQLFVPRGFAHGFSVMSESADFVYKCDEYYMPDDECGLRWNDAQIGIVWPEFSKAIISEKDAQLPNWQEAQKFK